MILHILSTNIRFWFIFTYYFSYINKRKCRQFQSILKRTLFLTFRKLKKQGHYVTKIIFFFDLIDLGNISHFH